MKLDEDVEELPRTGYAEDRKAQEIGVLNLPFNQWIEREQLGMEAPRL